jgi:hypothetical protein
LEDMHDPILVQRLAMVDAENDYPRLAGLSMTFAAPVASFAEVAQGAVASEPVAGVAVPDAPTAAPAADGEAAPVKKKVVKKVVTADGEAAPVKKKVVKKAVTADGEAAPVKKKVVKKKVAAAE